MQQIARAEDIEFKKLKASTQEVIRNMFVFTANDLGVRRFEKILGITPKAAQSLDDRKIYIISMLNRRKMSLSELTAMLSNYSEGIELINDMSNMRMFVCIKIESGNKISVLNKIIDDILPLNIFYKFCLSAGHTINVNYKNIMQIIISFWPRQNLEPLKLDGTWKLNGNWKLNGYKSNKPIDFYPINIAVRVAAKEAINYWYRVVNTEQVTMGVAYNQTSNLQAKVYTRRPLNVLQLDGAWKLNGSKRLKAYDYGESNYYPVAANIETGAWEEVRTGEADVKVINKLSGTWKLNGSHKLNAGTYQL